LRKQQLGEVSVKLYDKFGIILRIEVTSNNVSAFKRMRSVYKKDGTVVNQGAPVQKRMYSLFPLITIFKNAVRWYLEFVSTFDDPPAGMKKLDNVTDDVSEHDRTDNGFNFFDTDDEQILLAVAAGNFTLKGLSNKGLRKMLPGKSPGPVTRILKRLRLHGLIKKISRTYH
jgi:hypothetical protein